MMTKATNFSIIIPCFNEELAIPRFLSELSIFRTDFCKKFGSVELQVIFVDNNSTDRSYELLKTYCANEPLTRLIRCAAQGYGAALKFGFAEANHSMVVNYFGFLDLDNTYPLDIFLAGLDLMINNPDASMLMTNRFSDMSQMPILRKIGNKFFAQLVKMLFGAQITDVCSGLRIIHSHKISEVIALSEDGLNFSIQLTCVALKNSWKVSYLQMLYNERSGQSKLSVIKDGLEFLKIVLKVKFFK